MANTKEPKVTDAMQKVAVDFIEELIIMLHFNKDFNGNENDHRPLNERIDEFINKQQKKYALCTDPFTLFPCTSKEFCELSHKYEIQLAEEKYGHHDWL